MISVLIALKNAVFPLFNFLFFVIFAQFYEDFLYILSVFSVSFKVVNQRLCIVLAAFSSGDRWFVMLPVFVFNFFSFPLPEILFLDCFVFLSVAIYINYWFMRICIAKYLKESYIVTRRCK